MFQSRTREIIIPQSEHARFAAAIALVWGNQDIRSPQLPRESFALGVAIHDRGYGAFDSMALGAVDRQVWLATQRRGILDRAQDPVADTVALMHLRRLVAGLATPPTEPSLPTDQVRAAAALVDTASAAIDENLSRTEFDRDSFERADTVTRACDMISLRFCFEEATSFPQRVWSGADERDIMVTVSGDATVTLDPWPLSIDVLSGYVLAYRSAGYPDHREAVLVPYVVKAKENEGTAWSP